MCRLAEAQELREKLDGARRLRVAGHAAGADHAEVDVGGHAARAPVVRRERVVAVRRVGAQASTGHVGGPAGGCGAWAATRVAQPADGGVALARRGEEGLL